jgi:hypothetical protein
LDFAEKRTGGSILLNSLHFRPWFKCQRFQWFHRFQRFQRRGVRQLSSFTSTEEGRLRFPRAVQEKEWLPVRVEIDPLSKTNDRSARMSIKQFCHRKLTVRGRTTLRNEGRQNDSVSIRSKAEPGLKPEPRQCCAVGRAFLTENVEWSRNHSGCQLRERECTSPDLLQLRQNLNCQAYEWPVVPVQTVWKFLKMWWNSETMVWDWLNDFRWSTKSRPINDDYSRPNERMEQLPRNLDSAPALTQHSPQTVTDFGSRIQIRIDREHSFSQLIDDRFVWLIYRPWSQSFQLFKSILIITAQIIEWHWNFFWRFQYFIYRYDPPWKISSLCSRVLSEKSRTLCCFSQSWFSWMWTARESVRVSWTTQVKWLAVWYELNDLQGASHSGKRRRFAFSFK